MFGSSNGIVEDPFTEGGISKEFMKIVENTKEIFKPPHPVRITLQIAEIPLGASIEVD